MSVDTASVAFTAACSKCGECNPHLGDVIIMHSVRLKGILPYCDSHMPLLSSKTLLHLGSDISSPSFNSLLLHVSIPLYLCSSMSLFVYVSIPPCLYPLCLLCSYSTSQSLSQRILKMHYSNIYTQLKLNGLTIDETDNHQHDMDFLNRMWLLREAIEDATATGDTATLQQIKASNSGQYNACCLPHHCITL